jgi:CHAT domain-containing protein
VVLSRWKTDDTVTALLMVRFYENLLGKRKGMKALGRAESLAEARKWLRELDRKQAAALVAKEPVLPGGERPFAHPFYWASFILIGDPD